MLRNNILCVGDNTVVTDQQCRKIAEERMAEYKGMVCNTMPITAGCYHTCVEDLGVDCVQDLLDQFDQVIFLDSTNTKTQIIKDQYTLVDTPKLSVPNDTIIFVGCSHTYGTGHQDASTVYTSILAEMLDYDFVVLGNCGQSNQEMEDVLANYSLAGAKVVIQFTDIFRMRYFNSKTNQVKHVRGPHYTKQEIEMFDDARQFYEFTKIVDRIVARLRDAGAEFLYFQLTPEHAQDTKLFQMMARYKEFCFVTDYNKDLADDHCHFGLVSHNYIAEHLYKRWNKLYAKKG